MNIKEIKHWLSLTQDETKVELTDILIQKGYRVHSCGNGLIAVSAFGKVPTLVAHMDTINTHRCSDEIFDAYFNCELFEDGFIKLTSGAKKAGVKCLGADDRAGIYTIIKAMDELESEHLPHVIFTTDEEVGCVGSSAMTSNTCSGCIEFLNMMETNVLIQVDRGRHENSWQEAVYYDYDVDSSRLEDDILNAGFVTAHGSYTDIGELAPYLQVPAVNISASYEFEHRPEERLNWHMFKTNYNNLMYFLSQNWYVEYGKYKSNSGYDKTGYGTASFSGSEDWYYVQPSVYDMQELINDINEFAYVSTLDETELDKYLQDIFGTHVGYRETFLDNYYTWLGGGYYNG